MQMWFEGEEARRWACAGVREEKKALGSLRDHRAADHAALRRLFGDVDRSRTRCGRLPGQLHALGGPVRRNWLDVARRRTALRVSKIRPGYDSLWQYRRSSLAQPDAHCDGVGPAQEKEPARQGAF